MPKTLFALDNILAIENWPEQSGWQGCWIGLQRIKPGSEAASKFQWTDGTFLEPSDNLAWIAGQPASVGGPNDCVELFSPDHKEPVCLNLKMQSFNFITSHNFNREGQENSTTCRVISDYNVQFALKNSSCKIRI